MPRILRSWWLILPVCSTVATVARLTMIREQARLSRRQHAALAFQAAPPEGRARSLTRHRIAGVAAARARPG